MQRSCGDQVEKAFYASEYIPPPVGCTQYFQVLEKYGAEFYTKSAQSSELCRRNDSNIACLRSVCSEDIWCDCT